MMKLKIFIGCLIGCLALSTPTQAQFFKKLKKAVNKTVKSVATETHDVSALDTAANSRGTYTVNPTSADLSAYHVKTVYALQPGEKFDFTESCLAMQAGISSYQVVIIKDGERYHIGKDGQRIPVEDNNIKACPAFYETNLGGLVKFSGIAYSAPNVDGEAGDNSDELYTHSSSGVTGNFQMTNNFTPEQMKKMEAMADNMSEEQDNGGPVDTASMMKMAQMGSQIHSSGNLKYDKNAAGTFINFNHKKYGPYAYVQSMVVNKEHTKFVAIVTPGEPDMPMSPKSWSLVINSEGGKKKYAFQIARLLPFGDFNHYRILIGGIGHKVLYDPATGQKISMENYDQGEIMIDKVTGAFVQKVSNKIYLDGKLSVTIPNGDFVKMKNIFVSPDHKRCAVWTADGLFLPDGNMIDGVVSCSARMQQNKKMLNWMVLGRDNKTLYLCHENL